MYARLKKFLGKALGNVVYWIGWVLAILVIAQATILSVTSGNPLVPVLLGGVGLIIWLITSKFRPSLADDKYGFRDHRPDEYAQHGDPMRHAGSE
jgi:hypothetical protein